MFEGFPDNSQNFLWELSFNNERAWFAEHKSEFEYSINNPMKELAKEMIERMNQRFPLVNLEMHLSRIYRDARRLYGRGPYKDHMWFSIKNRANGMNGPMFFFEVSPQCYCYGMGLYCSKASEMEAFRKSIDVNPDRFKRLAEGVAIIDGVEIEGPEYKKHKGNYTGTVNEWYNRRYVSAVVNRDYDDLIKSSELADSIFETFSQLMPMYEYLNVFFKEVI